MLAFLILVAVLLGIVALSMLLEPVAGWFFRVLERVVCWILAEEPAASWSVVPPADAALYRCSRCHVLSDHAAGRCPHCKAVMKNGGRVDE